MTTTITTSSSGPYAASAQTTFPVTFQSESVDGIQVTLDGATVSPTAYTFNRDTDGTGSVVFTSAVTGSVRILSSPLFQQTANFPRNGPFFPDFINAPLDRLARGSIYLKNLVVDLSTQVGSVVAAATAAAQAVIDSAVFTISTVTGVMMTTRTLLAGIASPANGQNAYLSEAGRQGLFTFSTANLSAAVTSDPYQGLYVAPTAAPSGASGAWVRDRPSPNVFKASWYGISSANSEATNKAIWTSMFTANLPGNMDIEVPATVHFAVAQIPYQTVISTVTIRGAAAPATWFGTLTSAGYALSSSGPIMKSAATAGGAVSGGVIEVLPGPGPSRSRVKLNVINMGIRTYDNPNQHGINAYYAEQLTVDGCAIDTGVWPSDATQPTNVRYGIRVPGIGNGALTSIRDTVILNYYVGHDISEHLVTNNVTVVGCKYGRELLQSNHRIEMGADGIYRCQTPFLVSGEARFKFRQMGIERVNATNEPGHWQISTYDLVDPLNYGKGAIEVVPVLGYSGPVSTFTRNGGRNITVTVEGAPRVAKYGRASNLPLNTGVATTITFTTAVDTPAVVLDTGTMQRVTFKEYGLFQLTLPASFPANSTGIRRIAFYAQDGTLLGEDSRNAATTGTTSFDATANIRITDAITYIVVVAEQTSGSPLDLVCTAYLGGLTVEKISA